MLATAGASASGSWAGANTVGGTTPGAGNVISGNGIGVYLSDGTTGVQIEGNYIGVNAAGTAALGNTQDGVLISGPSGTFGSANTGGSTDNTIGGTTAGARNVISGNSGDGVEISGAGTTGNVVEGNYIGVDATGAVARQRRQRRFAQRHIGNIVGGTTASARNVISGNATDGVSITGTGLPTGLASLWSGNGSGADSVGGNNLTLNGAVTFVPGEVGDAYSFGTNSYASLAQPVVASVDNWSFDSWAEWNGSTPGAASQYLFYNGSGGSNGYGLLVKDSGTNIVPGTTGELVVLYGGQQFIATGYTLPTGQFVHLALVRSAGVLTLYVNGQSVFSQATTNPNVPDRSSGAGFILSGPAGSNGNASFNGLIDAASMWNTGLTQAQVAAIYNAGSAGKGNLVEGNYIGTNAAGTAALGNYNGVAVYSAGNTIGGMTAGAGNVISGSYGFDAISGTDAGVGVLIEGSAASGNLVEGNFIGTDKTGTIAGQCNRRRVDLRRVREHDWRHNGGGPQRHFRKRNLLAHVKRP